MHEGESRNQAIAIGRAITRLHRDHYGRGSTAIRTVIQRNVVLVLLEDIYTPAEHTLISADQHDEVKSSRQLLQMAVSQKLIDAVEEIMERTVIAFMSQVHFGPDMAAEIFVLQPTTHEDVTADPTDDE